MKELRFLLFLAALSVLAGCAQHVTPLAPPLLSVKEPADRTERLYQQVRSGSYQISAAMDVLARVLADLKQRLNHADKEVAAKFGPTQQALDQAGEKLADFSNPPLELADFKKDVAEQDARRKRALQAAQDALDAVRAASGALQDAPPSLTSQAGWDHLTSDLATTEDGLQAAVSVLGGTG